MREVIFLLSAEIDVQGAFDNYETWQEGRGEVFLRCLDAALEQLCRFPESGARYYQKYRRLLVPHFPIGIFYTVEARGIIVAGIMDTRRDPKEILRRMR